MKNVKNYKEKYVKNPIHQIFFKQFRQKRKNNQNFQNLRNFSFLEQSGNIFIYNYMLIFILFEIIFN